MPGRINYSGSYEYISVDEATEIANDKLQQLELLVGRYELRPGLTERDKRIAVALLEDAEELSQQIDRERRGYP